MEFQARFPALGYESEPSGWWSKFLEKIELSFAMVILNTVGINIVHSLSSKNIETSANPP
jgi:hypothetical protein